MCVTRHEVIVLLSRGQPPMHQASNYLTEYHRFGDRKVSGVSYAEKKSAPPGAAMKPHFRPIKSRWHAWIVADRTPALELRGDTNTVPMSKRTAPPQ
jgi:hypothetical protein